MYFILTHNVTYGIIYLTREHSPNGLPCWFLKCLHRQNLVRVRRCNFFCKNHFYLLLFQVSDNKRRNTKKQCCKLYHARKSFPGHLITTTLLQGKSVRPLCAVQNSVTALRYIFYHKPCQESTTFGIFYYIM